MADLVHDAPGVLGLQLECPKHGLINGIATIASTIPGHEGRWCQRCWIEPLDATGVCRVTEAKPTSD